MAKYKTIKKCLKIGCNKTYSGKGYFCDEHKVIKSNNEIGYNQFKTNPKPKLKESEIITQDTVKQAYRDFWVAKRDMLSKAQKFARLNKIFCGLDKVEDELKLTWNDK